LPIRRAISSDVTPLSGSSVPGVVSGGVFPPSVGDPSGGKFSPSVGDGPDGCPQAASPMNINAMNTAKALRNMYIISLTKRIAA
jgi:hypothetical protein